MRILLSLFFAFVAQLLLAQTDSTRTQGEIISGEIVIEKDNKIILPQADKIYVRSVPNAFSDAPINVTFQVNEPTFEWPDYKSDVPFKTLNEQYPLEGFQNYVKLGFGNYSSPLFEAGLFQTLGAFQTKTKLFYESFKSGPVNDENSGNTLASLDISGTYRKNAFIFTPSLKYNVNRYSFYGNANRINAGFDATNPADVTLSEWQFEMLLSGMSKDLTYNLKPFVSYTDQNMDSGTGLNTDRDFGVTGYLSYQIDDYFTTGFNIEGRGASYDGGIQYNRSLFNINPWVRHRKDELSITAGFMLSSGKAAEESKTGFYPRAKIEYNLSKQWTIYGLLSGGQAWNGLNQLLSENQFLDDSLSIAQQEFTSQFGGGFKGTPFKNVLLDLSLTYSSIKGLPFYVPSNSDSSRYTLAYDTESVGVVTLKSNLSFMPTATSTYGINLEINGYSVESLDRPWHRPSYILKAYTSHNVQEKLIISAYLTSMGGVRGAANVDFGYVKLPAFTDLGLGAKYLITSRASAFIDVNNLLNNEYERYLGYPTRGLTFKIGGQYRF
ncbi:MAG: hypothetical protein ABJG47_14410 [Ekhidna sp.]